MAKYRQPLAKVTMLNGFERDAWAEVKDSNIATPKELTDITYHLDEIRKITSQIQMRLNKKL